MSVYFEGLVEDRLYLFAFSSTSFMMKDITEERRFKRRLILSIVVGLVLVIAAAAYVLALYALNKGPLRAQSIGAGRAPPRLHRRDGSSSLLLPIQETQCGLLRPRTTRPAIGT